MLNVFDLFFLLFAVCFEPFPSSCMFFVPELLGSRRVDDIVGDVNAAGLFCSGEGRETEDGRRGRAVCFAQERSG